MQREHYDIFVSGGGLAGLIAACAFGSVGYSVLCVDPAPPITTKDNPIADRRSTAFLQPAQTTLADIGLWDRFKGHAAPLQIMRLADAGDTAGELRHVADFDAAEVSDGPFGWNLPNWLLRREILVFLENLPNVRFQTGVRTSRLLVRSNEALISLSDGTRVSAKLVVAADGRKSPIREMLGIGVKTWRYGQKATVFTVSHALPHQNISTEVHRTGGPFTLVPLPDQDGTPQSAVVWMETAAESARLKTLDDVAFAKEATLRSCSILGPLTLSSDRHVWPIISQKADALFGPRTALVAEAAHVVPPIGAQGLNMSLADIQALLDLCKTFDDVGDPALLKAYSRRRLADVTARVHGVDLLNRAALVSSPNLRALRLKGLQILHGSMPLRQAAMHAGLGV